MLEASDRDRLVLDFITTLSELTSLDFRLSPDWVSNDDGPRYSAVVGIVGAHKGRVVLEGASQSVLQVTKSMNFDEPVEDVEERCLFFAELTNMLGGRLTTLLNNAQPHLQLRLTPPAVFSGVNLVLRTPNAKSEEYYFTAGDVALKLKLSMEGM